MARQWQIPNGPLLNEGGTARTWQIPGGPYVSEESSGGGGGGATPLFRNSPNGQLSGLGSSGKFFQNPLQ